MFWFRTINAGSAWCFGVWNVSRRVLPGLSGFGCAGLDFLRYAALCPYRVLRTCYGTLLRILWPDTKWFSGLQSVCFDVCFCSGFRPSAVRSCAVGCKHYGCFMVQCVIMILYVFLLEIEFVQPLFCLLFGTFFTKECKNIGFALPFDAFRYVKGKLSHPYWPAFAAWNVAFRAAFRWFLLHILSASFVSSGVTVLYDCTRFLRYFKPYACLFLKSWVLEPYCKSKSKRFAAYSVNVSCAAVACLIVICLLLLDLVVCCGRLVLLSILCFVCFGVSFVWAATCFTCRLCPFMRQPVAGLFFVGACGESRGLNRLKRI